MCTILQHVNVWYIKTSLELYQLAVLLTSPCAYLLSLSLQFLHAVFQGFILLPPCSDVILQD